MTESVRHPARRCTARGTEINSPKEASIYDVLPGRSRNTPNLRTDGILHFPNKRVEGVKKNSKFMWTSYTETPKAHNALEEESAFEKFELEVAKVSPFVPAITLAAAAGASERAQARAPAPQGLPFVFMRPTSYYGTGAQFNWILKTLLNILLIFLLSFIGCPTVLQNSIEYSTELLMSN